MSLRILQITDMTVPIDGVNGRPLASSGAIGMALVERTVRLSVAEARRTGRQEDDARVTFVAPIHWNYVKNQFVVVTPYGDVTP
ncbi:MAG: hypothetical protein ACRDZ4_04665 [Egibacteraceae bacterium]